LKQTNNAKQKQLERRLLKSQMAEVARQEGVRRNMKRLRAFLFLDFTGSEAGDRPDCRYSQGYNTHNNPGQRVEHLKNSPKFP